MSKQTKTTYGFRKAKDVTTIGGTEIGSTPTGFKMAVLAGSVALVPLFGGTVSAEEVTSPTTTAPETAVTAPTTAPVAEAPQPIPTPTGLDEAITNAEANNVNVTTTTETTGDVQTANDSYAEQTKTVNDTTAQAIAEQKAHADAQAKYQADKALVDQKNAETKAKEDALKANNIAKDENAGIYVTGKFDETATGADYYKDITVVATTTDAKDFKDIGYNNSTVISNPKGVTLSQFDPNRTDQFDITGTTSDFYYRIDDITKGGTFTYKNAATASDGTNLNLKLTFDNIAKNDASDGKQYILLGKTANGGFAFNYWNFKGVPFTGTWIDDNGKPVKMTMASIVGDVDNGQKSAISFTGNTLNFVNPDGSGLTAEGDGLRSNRADVVDGFTNAPKGTYLAVGSSDTFNYTHTTDDGNLTVDGHVTNLIEFDLFGNTAKVTTQTFNYLKDPTKPVAPAPKSVKVTKFNLVKPQPVKGVQDTNGNDINNQNVKLGDKIIYVGTWDNDQYKDIVTGAVAISKGSAWLENYDEKAGTPIWDEVSFTDSVTGKAVEGLKLYIIKNIADAPQAIKDLVKNSGENIEDNDEFAIWVADDYQAFFDTYQKTGHNIDFKMPFKVNPEFTGDKFDNVIYQIDFGQGHVSNVVTNTVERPTPPTPEKPVTPTSEKPVTPTSATPVQKGAVLPQTGSEGSSLLSALGLGILSILFGFSFAKKREN